jgi:Protein of unknown function (DUF1524)
MSPTGVFEHGVYNTRALGGSAVRQHYVLLLAGRHLSAELFSRLAHDVENLMFIFLVTNTPAKDYERLVVAGAELLRTVTSEAQYEAFRAEFFEKTKRARSAEFDRIFASLHGWDLRVFRLKYLLAKLTQYVDVRAYGTGAQSSLAHYIEGNDIEHILPEVPSPEALSEFGEPGPSYEVTNRLGNLALLERAINRSLANRAYSAKAPIYRNSVFLLVKCLPSKPTFGHSDQITRAISDVPSFPTWTIRSIEIRQAYLARLARDVWDIPD